MKILIITKHYLAQKGGGSNGSRAYIKALRDIYGCCSIIYPDMREDPMPHLFGEEGVEYIPCYDDRSFIRKGLDVYLGKIHRTLGKVKEVLSQQSFDIVFIDHSNIANGVLKYVRQYTDSKVVTIHHNFEVDYMKDNRNYPLIRIPLSYFSIKAERDSLMYSDLGLTVTENDRKCLIEYYGIDPQKLEYFGSFFDNDIIAEDFSLSEQRNKTKLIITCALYFPQNTGPVVDFLNIYYPKVKERFPQLSLTIAGRNPSQEIEEACARQKDVDLVPNPVDMGQVLEKGGVYICPTDKGSGIKLRVFDGLKYGMPIILHQNSIWGYEPMVEKGIAFIYHDVDTFIGAVKNVLNRNIDPIDVRRAFSEYYSFTAGKERIRKALAKHYLL